MSKRLYFNFLIFMMMVTTFLPVVSNNLPKFMGSFHLYGPLFIVSVLIFEPKVFFHKNILITLGIAIFLLLILPFTIWIYIDEWNLNAQRYEFYFIFTALLTFYYYQKRNDFVSYAHIVNATIIFIAITLIMTIYSTIIDPMYARSLAGNLYTGEDLESFRRIGGGSYGTAIAIMALIPMLFYYYINNHHIKYSKRIVFIYCVLILLALIRMQFFGNILIAAIIVILSFQGYRGNMRSLFVISISIFVVLIIPKEIYATILNFVSTFFNPESDIFYKVTDMSDFLISGDLYGGTGAGGRVARYPELLITFLHSPLLGSSFNEGELYIESGAHLYWMNRLAIWGLFGFILFLQIFTRNIRFFLKSIPNEEFLYYYLLSIGSIIGYGLIKSISGREVWFMFFFVVPGIYYLPLLKNRSHFNIKN